MQYNYKFFPNFSGIGLADCKNDRPPTGHNKIIKYAFANFLSSNKWKLTENVNIFPKQGGGLS